MTNSTKEKRTFTLPIWAYPIVMGLPLFIAITAWYLIDKSNANKEEILSAIQNDYDPFAATTDAISNSHVLGYEHNIYDGVVHVFIQEMASLTAQDSSYEIVEINTFIVTELLDKYSGRSDEYVIHFPSGVFYINDFPNRENYENITLIGFSNLQTKLCINSIEGGFFSNGNFQRFRIAKKE